MCGVSFPEALRLSATEKAALAAQRQRELEEHRERERRRQERRERGRRGRRTSQDSGTNLLDFLGDFGGNKAGDGSDSN